MIINLTQHAPTLVQIAAGVVNPPNQEGVRRLLTFDDIPSLPDMLDRAESLVRIARAGGASRALIGGAPFFMAHLEAALWAAGIEPVHAFTRREMVEEPQSDGSVRKVAVFRHIGFIAARNPRQD